MAYTGSLGLRRIKRNAHRRERYRLLAALSPQEKFDREQRLLWYKLHSIFTHKEFIVHEYLPEVLRNTIAPFEDFIFPTP